jgi:hypothetical protein
MRSSLIEGDHRGLEKPRALFLVKDQEVIQACSSHAPQEAFTDGIRLGSSVRRAKYFDATCRSHARQMLPEFAIIIPNQLFWSVSIWSRLPQLLRDPRIGRGSGHIDVDDLARLQLDDEESKQWTEEEIRHLQEITSPDLCCMVAQERFPVLSTGSFGANRLHILLNRPFDFSAYPA